MFENILENVRQTTPLVHNITNYVTVNDCANVLLACGGSPIMADDEAEVEEITAICTATNINIGTLNSRTIAAMHKAGRKATALGHPTVLDPVGAGASALRTNTALELMNAVPFTVLRGNVSEIKTLAAGSGTTKGVDADMADAVTNESLGDSVAFVKALSARTGAVIAMTGAIDIVADAGTAYVLRNGHPFLSRVSGTGCMLSAVIAAYIGANPGRITEAAAAAVCLMGLAGERAYATISAADAGTGSYRVALLDEISMIDATALQGGARVEIH